MSLSHSWVSLSCYQHSLSPFATKTVLLTLNRSILVQVVNNERIRMYFLRIAVLVFPTLLIIATLLQNTMTTDKLNIFSQSHQSPQSKRKIYAEKVGLISPLNYKQTHKKQGRRAIFTNSQIQDFLNSLFAIYCYNQQTGRP